MSAPVFLIATNVEHLRRMGFLMLVRPALMLKSTEIFEYERKHSQRTGSVAKIAGGLEKVQPITKHE